MQILAKDIPAGSYELTVYEDGEDVQTADYFLSVNLKRIDESTAEVSKASGRLSNEININIGLKALELGFTDLVFYVTKGHRATHWAEYVRSDDRYDYYKVNLTEAYKRYTSGA